MSKPVISGTSAEAGWDTLYQQHGRKVFAAAYRITRSAADAEDILQTVFLRLLRRPAAAGAVVDAAAYLHRAAVHAALDCLRGRAAAGWVVLEGEAADPAGATSDSGLAAALRAALVKLPLRTAEVFTLRHIEGWDNRQIARQLGLTPVHVAVLLHRARRQLQRELQEYRGGS